MHKKIVSQEHLHHNHNFHPPPPSSSPPTSRLSWKNVYLWATSWQVIFSCSIRYGYAVLITSYFLLLYKFLGEGQSLIIFLNQFRSDQILQKIKIWQKQQNQKHNQIFMPSFYLFCSLFYVCKLWTAVPPPPPHHQQNSSLHAYQNRGLVLYSKFYVFIIVCIVVNSCNNHIYIKWNSYLI